MLEGVKTKVKLSRPKKVVKNKKVKLWISVSGRNDTQLQVNNREIKLL